MLAATLSLCGLPDREILLLAYDVKEFVAAGHLGSSVTDVTKALLAYLTANTLLHTHKTRIVAHQIGLSTNLRFVSPVVASKQLQHISKTRSLILFLLVVRLILYRMMVLVLLRLHHYHLVRNSHLPLLLLHLLPAPRSLDLYLSVDNRVRQYLRWLPNCLMSSCRT